MSPASFMSPHCPQSVSPQKSFILRLIIFLVCLRVCPSPGALPALKPCMCCPWVCCLMLYTLSSSLWFIVTTWFHPLQTLILSLLPCSILCAPVRSVPVLTACSLFVLPLQTDPVALLSPRAYGIFHLYKPDAGLPSRGWRGM